MLHFFFYLPDICPLCIPIFIFLSSLFSSSRTNIFHLIFREMVIKIPRNCSNLNLLQITIFNSVLLNLFIFIYCFFPFGGKSAIINSLKVI